MTRIVIAGGGTGGHLYPGLALADALAGRGVEVVYVGAAGGIEARVVPTTGYRLHLLPGRQLRGGGLGRAARGLATATGATLRAVALLGTLRPALVVGVGGYASVAVVVAAALRRIPSVLLEQNVVPGAANRMLVRLARRVCVGFAESIRFFPPGRAVHTGNPVRADLLRPRPARTRPGLLVFGGSAGAHKLNEATVGALAVLGPTARGLDVTHQTGAADVDAVRARYAGLGLTVRVEPFITDMGAAYAAADVVVGRAGAMTCAEVTAVGLPAILVPYPYAADDHQRANAEVLVEAGAAYMILDAELTPERASQAIRALVTNRQQLAAMARDAAALGRPDATAAVVRECLACLPHPGRTDLEGACR